MGDKALPQRRNPVPVIMSSGSDECEQKHLKKLAKGKHSLTLNSSDHFLSSAAMVSMGLVVDLVKTTESEQARNRTMFPNGFFFKAQSTQWVCVRASY